MGLGTGEIILIIFVVTVVFGASKLPQLGDGLGKAIGSFKRALSGANEIEATPKKADQKAGPEGAARTETAQAQPAPEPPKPTDKA